MAPIFYTREDLFVPTAFIISTWLFSARFFPPKWTAWQQWSQMGHCRGAQSPQQPPGSSWRWSEMDDLNTFETLEALCSQHYFSHHISRVAASDISFKCSAVSKCRANSHSLETSQRTAHTKTLRVGCWNLQECREVQRIQCSPRWNQHWQWGEPQSEPAFLSLDSVLT